jgi:regulator of protease activity HflC (stomatin/prohibitin superfamily)
MEQDVQVLIIVAVVVVVLLLLGAAMSVRVVKQYEQGVLFRLGRVLGARTPGLRVIIPFVDVLHKVALRIVTMPIQSRGIITQGNVSVDVSAVAYFRVVDAVKSVVAIENVYAAIDQIAQTTLRKVVGQHSLDQTLSETDKINLDIRKILDVSTVEWGVEVTLVELKDIQLPDSMKRAMARQAEAEREKRAKIINAQGESLAAAALGDASDIMMAHPPARAAAAQPAEPGRDRRGQEHHGGVPGPADDHHRGTRLLPDPRGGSREPCDTSRRRPAATRSGCKRGGPERSGPSWLTSGRHLGTGAGQQLHPGPAGTPCSSAACTAARCAPYPPASRPLPGRAPVSLRLDAQARRARYRSRARGRHPTLGSPPVRTRI